MGRGILSGVFWGGLTGALVLVVLSLYVPIPERAVKAAMVESPEAPEVDETPAVEPETPVEEPEVVVPEAPTEEAPVVEPEASAEPEAPTPAVELPGAPALESAQSDEQPVVPALGDDATASVEAPTLGTDAAESPAVIGGGADKPDVADLATDAPTAPEQSDAPQIALLDPGVGGSDVVSPSAPSATLSDDAPQDIASPSPRATDSTDALAAPATDDALPRVAGPTEAETVSSDTPIAVPVPAIDNPVEAPAATVVTNRLPSVTSPSEPEAQEELPEAEPAVLDAAEVGALAAYAAQFDVPSGTNALMSVVLIDSGADGISREELLKLSVPFSVAIDPAAADADTVAKNYRAAGIEVLAMLNDLPVSAEPSDVEVAMGGYFDVLNESIAVLDPLDGRIQSNRSLLQPVLGAIRETGHGLVTYDRGLNSAQQAARREGIAAATVFRLLDGELEEAPKIKRYLTRAAFNAGKDGSVVVVGRSYPETVKAVLEWTLDAKQNGLAIVPISVIMQSERG